jgi:hypothetical protein
MRAILATLTLCLFVLPAQAKYSGGTGEPNDPHQIATAADLIALGETPEDYDKHLLLTADIDLDPNLPGRKVFDRAVIGPTWEIPFAGVFNRRGHTIRHLSVLGASYLGLFGRPESAAQVTNPGVVDVNITGSGDYVAGLVGQNVSGSVTHCYSAGVVSGGGQVGGLVAENYGDVAQGYGAGAVSGTGGTAGLVSGEAWLVTASFWDLQTSGQTPSAGGTGKTTAETQTSKTFLDAGRNFVGERVTGRWTSGGSTKAGTIQRCDGNCRRRTDWLAALHGALVRRHE